MPRNKYGVPRIQVLSQGGRVFKYLALLYYVLKGRSLHMMCMVPMEYKLLARCVCSVPGEITFSSNVLSKESITLLYYKYFYKIPILQSSMRTEHTQRRVPLLPRDPLIPS